MPTEPLSTLAEDEGELPEATPTPTPQVKTTPAAPTEPTEDGEPPKKKVDLEAALAELTGTVKTLATPKKEEPRQLTPEEMNKKWAVFEPEKADPKFFHKLFNLPADTAPEVLDAIKTTWGAMQNGLMRQALQGAMNLVEHRYGAHFAKIDELEQWRSQASAKELRRDFNTTYPALADPKYDKIIKFVDTELADQEFPDHSAYFKALAEGAAVHIKSINPAFELGEQTKPTAGKTPALPRTRVGGSGGAAGGGSKPDPEGDQSSSLEL